MARRRLKTLAVLAAVLWACASAAPAYAHVPQLESPAASDEPGSERVPYPTAQSIEAPDISRAVYGYLARDTRFDAYAFTVDRPITTRLELLVPVRAGLAAYQPVLTIYSEATAASMTADPVAAEQRFFEPFSLASFRRVAEGEFTFKPGDRYYAVVEPGIGARSYGPYVIGVSGAERFTPGDWVDTARVLPTIWVGSWSGGPARPGAYVCAVFAVVLAIAGIAFAIRRRRSVAH